MNLSQDKSKLRRVIRSTVLYNVTSNWVIFILLLNAFNLARRALSKSKIVLDRLLYKGQRSAIIGEIVHSLCISELQ